MFRRTLALTAGAVTFGLVAFWIVFVIRVGGVILIVSADGRHGVHSGDLLGVTAGVASLLLAAAALRDLARQRKRGHRSARVDDVKIHAA